ncbi:hypothetical protein [Larkinella soli]|uniref:hypothetical protein n=1 Tax=Larkinella soli TaxID=1770527 RepID=UPI000FFC74B1|nr:hypothetical protein [Larkinella soli]
MSTAPQYFDFHFHPAFKQFICQFEPAYPSTRDVRSLLKPIDLKNPITDFLEEEFLHILESQACLEQLSAGKLMLGIANVAAIERMFAEKEGLFGKVLNSQFLTKPVDQTYFSKIREGKISYYQLFIRELNHYKRLRDGGQITILSRKNPGMLDAPGALTHVAMAMEGGHSLCRTLIGQPGKPDEMTVSGSPEDEPIAKDFQDHPVLSPALSLEHLQTAMWAENMDLFSMVLTHLSHIPEQLLATHAYGMKMLKDEAIFPIGDGLTNAGKQVIDKAYSIQVGGADAPVLIDIKHMGLKSRLDFYAHRRLKGHTLPIIASHMGVSGYSLDEWKGALEEAHIVRLKASNTPVVKITTSRRVAGDWGATNKTFTFNPWTINLLDEDIEEVLNSNGLIGISLDVRILGWQNVLGKGEKEEFMSAEEFRFLFPEQFKKLSSEPMAAPESFLLPTKEERHPLSLCFNLLHVVSAGRIRTDKDPWKHITIGSDFDGLINPLINCRDASRMGNLENLLFRWLPVAEERYRRENGGGRLLKVTPQGEVDEDNLRRLIRDVLYENGKAFLTNWLKGSPGR